MSDLAILALFGALTGPCRYPWFTMRYKKWINKLGACVSMFFTGFHLCSLLHHHEKGQKWQFQAFFGSFLATISFTRPQGPSLSLDMLKNYIQNHLDLWIFGSSDTVPFVFQAFSSVVRWRKMGHFCHFSYVYWASLAISGKKYVIFFCLWTLYYSSSSILAHTVQNFQKFQIWLVFKLPYTSFFKWYLTSNFPKKFCMIIKSPKKNLR